MILIVLAAVAALLLGAGIAAIWALNTLFALGIAYSLKTAIAAALLVVIALGRD